MASWQFRCVCCGELRDAPMTRPEGNVYLRCTVSREWAWYEPDAFVLAAPAAATLRNGANRAKASRATGGRGRASSRRARGTSARRAASGARSSAGGAARKGARRARKRR